MTLPSQRQGFSLIEVLVTLVVASLIITVLMQALAQSVDLRERVRRHDVASRVAALQEPWFRETVASMVADIPAAMGSARGTETSVEFVTPVPLSGGGLARVRWWLEPVPGGYALHYRDPAWKQLVIVPGPLGNASFGYLGADGKWQPEWNPADDADEVLPRAVRLSATTATGELVWWVAVSALPYRPTGLQPESAIDGF